MTVGFTTIAAGTLLGTAIGLSSAYVGGVYRAPWMAIWPGVAISLAVFGFNRLGDRLRAVLDPRPRGA